MGLWHNFNAHGARAGTELEGDVVQGKGTRLRNLTLFQYPEASPVSVLSNQLK